MSALILVIEDNATNLELMTYLLNAFGYTTVVARDGQTGVELAKERQPALILCDLAMPVLDGYGVAECIKRDPALRDIPLLAVTASAMVGDRDRVLSSGFDDYISKPIIPETFVAQVEAHLHPRRQGES